MTGWPGGAPLVPSVAEIRLSGDEWVWLRLSDEAGGALLRPFTEFLAQVRVIGEALGPGEGQTGTPVGWAQMRLF